MEIRIKWAIILCYLTLLQGDDVAAKRSCVGEKKCRVSTYRGLKAADCYDKNFYNLPKCLPYDVEVLYLQHNRIRRLSKPDLENYPYLKHLYLTDNMLVNLDDDLFEDMKQIETIDLSLNLLTAVSPVIFHLPNLKSLYLSQNVNINIVDAVEKAKPIQGVLTQLHMSFITEKDDYFDFPNFGKMPFLAVLNISGNQYATLTPEHFAGLCNLQVLDSLNTTAEFEDKCDCWIINKWLKERKVRFTPFACEVEETACLDVGPADDAIQTYKSCKENLENIKLMNTVHKVMIGLAIMLGVIAIPIVFCAYRYIKKKNRRSTSNNIKKTTVPQNNPEDCALQLLNNQTK